MGVRWFAERSNAVVDVVVERPLIQRDTVEVIFEQELPVLQTASFADQEDSNSTTEKVAVSYDALFANFRFGMPERDWRISTTRNVVETGFAGPWDSENVALTKTGISLSIEKVKGGNFRPTLGAIQSSMRYGFGRYETILRAAKTKGAVTSFSISTGPALGTTHDEINVDILGIDTRSLYLGVLKDGVMSHAETVRLPFDTSRGFYHFAIEWRPDRIVLYVDGKEFHRIGEGPFEVPQYAGRVNLSTWTGTKPSQDWHGRAAFVGKVSAEFSCVSFTPLGDDPQSTCSDLYFNRVDTIDLASR